MFSVALFLIFLQVGSQRARHRGMLLRGSRHVKPETFVEDRLRGGGAEGADADIALLEIGEVLL